MCAPTMDSSEEDKVSFHLSLREAVCKVHLADKFIILGVSKARFGRDFETWTVLGRHGVDKYNSSSLQLQEFCSEMGFCIGSTMF